MYESKFKRTYEENRTKVNFLGNYENHNEDEEKFYIDSIVKRTKLISQDKIVQNNVLALIHDILSELNFSYEGKYPSYRACYWNMLTVKIKLDFLEKERAKKQMIVLLCKNYKFFNSYMKGCYGMMRIKDLQEEDDEFDYGDEMDYVMNLGNLKYHDLKNCKFKNKDCVVES